MAESITTKIPTTVTPYVLGLGILVLIVIFSFMSSVPWANKADIENIKTILVNEVNWLKAQNARIQQHLELIEAGRNVRAEQISEVRTKVSDCERRIQRLEDTRPRPP
jgi:hypothetical protein